MKDKLLALYELQQIDSGLDAINRQYAALDKGQAEHAQHGTAKAAHDEAEAARHAAEAAVQDVRLEQQGVKTKHDAEEKKLYGGKITNPKELTSLQEEVEMLARRTERLDEKLVTLTADLEACRARSAETKKTLAAAVAAYNVKAHAAQEQVTTMKAQAKTLTTQRAASAKEIAPDLLKRYDALRPTKQGLAIVALEDGNACGGCKMGLPRDTITRIREGSTIVVCENCNRMLVDKK